MVFRMLIFPSFIVHWSQQEIINFRVSGTLKRTREPLLFFFVCEQAAGKREITFETFHIYVEYVAVQLLVTLTSVSVSLAVPQKVPFRFTHAYMYAGTYSEAVHIFVQVKSQVGMYLIRGCRFLQVEVKE